jgi:hypothetical protein
MKKPGAQSDKEHPSFTPRLLDVAGCAHYLGIGRQSVRDWVNDGLLEPVQVPGASLRKAGKVIAGPRQRRMSKLLFDIRDLDRFIDGLKGDGGRT